MSDTTYADFSPPAVNAAWLNDINNFYYRQIGSVGNAAWGAGLLAYNPLLAYAAGTVGGILNSLGTNAQISSSIFVGKSDTALITEQLNTSAGECNFRYLDQLGNRLIEFLAWGTTSTPTYGMAVGSAGINTPPGVPLSLGAGDAVRVTFNPTTGDPLGRGFPVVRVKTLTTSISSNAVPANDPDLVAPLAIGLWSYKLFIGNWGTTTGTQGLKFNMNFSGSIANAWQSILGVGQGVQLTPSVTSAIGTVFGLGTITIAVSPVSADWFIIEGTINVTAPGNLSFQWSQNASSANATNVAAGSYLKCTKLN